MYTEAYKISNKGNTEEEFILNDEEINADKLKEMQLILNKGLHGRPGELERFMKEESEGEFKVACEDNELDGLDACEALIYVHLKCGGDGDGDRSTAGIIWSMLFQISAIIENEE